MPRGGRWPQSLQSGHFTRTRSDRSGVPKGLQLSSSRVGVALLLALCVLIANAYWLRMGVPVAVEDAHAARMACVSYAPYRLPGETPFDPGQRVARARIEEDLAALSRRFDCVRTYSVSAGLDVVPEIARAHGMKVLLGIWLSRTDSDNQKELAHGIEVANANRDVVRAVIVGNEVLLRGELPEQTLAAHIRRVGAATGLPVTYADVWEFWLKYPSVAPAVSFITIHILPYWEDEPVAVADAVAHVREIRARMQAAFPGRELLIGETGWPSEGRQRRGAVPSLVNEARFMREFLNWAQPAGVEYNLIEAFDQPWKRELEGTVGGYWGIYDRDLQEKFALAGPVIEEARWFDGVIAGLVGALLMVAAGLGLWRLRAAGLIGLMAAGDAIGATLFAQWRHIGQANRTVSEWILTSTLQALAVLTAIILAGELARWFDRQRDPILPLPLSSGLRALRAAGALIGMTRFAWLFIVGLMNLLLLFDGRYRDFPLLLCAAPIVGFFLCAAARGFPGVVRAAIEERLLAWWLIASALLVVAFELPSNLCADLWAGFACLLAASVLVSRAHGVGVGKADTRQ